MAKPYVSIVIPVYNEQDNLAALFTRLTAAMEMTGKSWEVLFTNDGSRDRSGEMLKEFHKQRPRQVRVIDFNGNSASTWPSWPPSSGCAATWS